MPALAHAEPLALDVADAPVFRTMDAVRTALEAELANDERVFVAGIDVGEGGNVFGLTRGLRERFGERVRDTPISETAIMGLGVGAAMAGMRPVVELMYLDFVGVCLDQLLNQAAKLPFMTGGAARDGAHGAHAVRRRPLVGQPALAEPRGAARAHPRPQRGDAVDARRHLRAAAGGDPGPEPGRLHREPVALRHEGAAAAGRPHRAHRESAVVRPGTDVTVVSVSRMVHEAVAAAEELAGDGISVEVIDLRTVAPLDLVPVLESVHKTSRLLIAHEAVVPFGIGAEIAATVAREAFWDLDAPIERIGAAATPPPYAPDLERAWLPDRADIAAAIRRLTAV